MRFAFLTFTELLVGVVVFLEFLDFFWCEGNYNLLAFVPSKAERRSRKLTVFLTSPSLVNLIPGKSWGKPSPTPNIVVDMRDIWQHARNYLNATRPVSNHGCSFALQESA